MVGFRPLDSTINEAALQEMKEIPEAHSVKETVTTEETLLVHDNARPDSAAL